MSPYRQPAPKHVCRFDLVRYAPPPLCFPIHQCSCGAQPPPTLAERMLSAIVTADESAATIARIVIRLMGPR